jgi:hypothetical protein
MYNPATEGIVLRLKEIYPGVIGARMLDSR